VCVWWWGGVAEGGVWGWGGGGGGKVNPLGFFCHRIFTDTFLKASVTVRGQLA